MHFRLVLILKGRCLQLQIGGLFALSMRLERLSQDSAAFNRLGTNFEDFLSQNRLHRTLCLIRAFLIDSRKYLPYYTGRSIHRIEVLLTALNYARQRPQHLPRLQIRRETNPREDIPTHLRPFPVFVIFIAMSGLEAQLSCIYQWLLGLFRRIQKSLVQVLFQIL